MDESGSITEQYEEDEYLNFGSTSVRPRFKHGLDMQKLMKEGASFEIDTDEGGAFLEDSEALEDPSFAELYKKEVVEKNNLSLQSLFKTMSLEGVSGNYDELARTMDDVIEDGGVKKLIVRAGKGDVVNVTSKIYVHYIAVSEGSDEPYDSTLVRGAPHSFKLADADMIPGLYLALTSMKVGEISKFIIHSEYAYKDCGIPPRVPPNCRILFTVELIDSILAEKLSDILQKTADERALLEFSEICREAERLRTEGNNMYIEARYSGAIRRYRDAIRILEDYPVVNQENENTRSEILFTLYINLAQSYLKLEKAPQACVASRMALRFDKASKGKLYKALFRFAKAKFLLGGYEEAKILCEKASRLAPATKSITELHSQIVQKMQEDDTNLKLLYKKMLKNPVIESSAAFSSSSPSDKLNSPCSLYKGSSTESTNSNSDSKSSETKF